MKACVCFNDYLVFNGFESTYTGSSSTHPKCNLDYPKSDHLKTGFKKKKKIPKSDEFDFLCTSLKGGISMLCKTMLSFKVMQHL